jgi:Ser/Thr protein kinase RdoA (MazF antagonist)
MANYVWGENETQFFYQLDPELVLKAIESLGLKTTGRCLTLNSMENRVYEIEIDIPDSQIESEGQKFVVAKFYRPGRWTEEQILDEHQFLKDLEEGEIPAVGPLEFKGKTLFKLQEHNIYYTVFPRKGGRAPYEMTEEQLQMMGRLLARLHNVGANREAKHRLHITPESFGQQNLDYLIKEHFIPRHLKESFISVFSQIKSLITPLFENKIQHRIHGDCHWGNIIWRDQEGPSFIDFDDMLVGPAIQDIWLVVPGEDEYALRDRRILLEAYDSMRTFDYSSLKLIEPLRTLRYIHFAAWIAKRSKDPAFQTNFPHFYEASYWDNLLTDLTLQLSKIKASVTPNLSWESPPLF